MSNATSGGPDGPDTDVVDRTLGRVADGFSDLWSAAENGVESARDAVGDAFPALEDSGSSGPSIPDDDSPSLVERARGAVNKAKPDGEWDRDRLKRVGGGAIAGGAAGAAAGPVTAAAGAAAGALLGDDVDAARSDDRSAPGVGTRAAQTLGGGATFTAMLASAGAGGPAGIVANPVASVAMVGAGFGAGSAAGKVGRTATRAVSGFRKPPGGSGGDGKFQAQSTEVEQGRGEDTEGQTAVVSQNLLDKTPDIDAGEPRAHTEAHSN